MNDGAPTVFARPSPISRASLDDVLRYGRASRHADDVMRRIDDVPAWLRDEVLRCVGVGLGMGLGPVGSSAPAPEWQATDVAGCILWLQPDPGYVTESSGAVSALADRSGTGDVNKNLAQANSANQPTLVASDANFNGRPTISFDGSNDYMVSGTWSSASTQPHTIYAVIRLSSASAVRSLCDGIVSTSRANITTTGTAGAVRVFAGSSHIDSAVSALNMTRVVCAVISGESSAIYVDRITTPNATGNAGAHSLTGLTLGAAYNIAQQWAGQVGSLIVYSGAHNSTTRGTVMNALGARFGVTVAA